ncbi:nucleoside hydrolase [Bacillus sp. FJAT-42376]|uniref:nucleoside hydrolase n=1 Tax=Bacillus sp. FJAT-42376 TaxID=2014076 RepID=UPI000F4DECEE|nr:nucleoside hydrolase [Bacillus sp. FJAT-42376]AZB42126.1 nucleoside hydrolase [Bacillus sp. FJAT-42376]
MKVLLFCDPGIDDSLAIIYALQHPGIDLLGIVTSYGNVSKEQATVNAAYLAGLAGRSDLPIISGAEFPLSGENTQYYPEIHGPDGLGPIRPPKQVQGNYKGFAHLFSIVKNHLNDLAIIDVGRSTSLSAAFNLNRDLMMRVNKIYLMGGAFHVPGNVTPLAEANFHGDPIAVNVVLKYAKEVFIAPLNITNHALVTREIANYIYTASRSVFKELIPPVTDFYAAYYRKMNPGMKGAPVHDVLPFYYMMNEGLLFAKERKVSVLTCEDGRGTSVADLRNSSRNDGSKRHIALQFNYRHFIADFIKIMTG